MSDLEILQRMKTIAETAMYALEQSEPFYLARLIAQLEHEIAQEPKP